MPSEQPTKSNERARLFDALAEVQEILKSGGQGAFLPHLGMLQDDRAELYDVAVGIETGLLEVGVDEETAEKMRLGALFFALVEHKASPGAHTEAEEITSLAGSGERSSDDTPFARAIAKFNTLSEKSPENPENERVYQASDGTKIYLELEKGGGREPIEAQYEVFAPRHSLKTPGIKVIFEERGGSSIILPQMDLVVPGDNRVGGIATDGSRWRVNAEGQEVIMDWLEGMYGDKGHYSPPPITLAQQI